MEIFSENKNEESFAKDEAKDFNVKINNTKSNTFGIVGRLNEPVR